MNACSPACGYCGRCTTEADQRIRAVPKLCLGCQRTVWQSIHDDRKPLCRECSDNRDYAYRREHEAGLY